MQKEKKKVFIFTIILLVLIIFSFSLGRYPIYPRELFKFVLNILNGTKENIPPDIYTIIVQIRLPRIIAALLVGSALSVAGSNYQALFQNPMVSPDILGASQGAGFGASLGLLLSMGYMGTSLLAFFMGILAVTITYLVSLRFKIDKILGLVLSGMTIGSIFSSLISFIKLIADTENTLPSITYWLMGSLASIKMSDLKIVVIPVILGLVVSLLLKWKMNLLTMGEEEATTMGINVKIIRLLIIISTTLMTSACVSVTGMIGWIGLIIPHFSRILVGNDYRFVVPVSALVGAVFLLSIDNIARTITTSEIPIGILTSFIGAPLFLYLIFKKGYD